MRDRLEGKVQLATLFMLACSDSTTMLETDPDRSSVTGLQPEEVVPGMPGSGMAGSTGQPGTAEGAPGGPTTLAGGTASPNENSANWVFDEQSFRTYSLSLDPAVWQNLQATARDEVYVAADLEVDGQVFSQVGLRFKGGFGTLYACFDETDTLVCPKLGMKIKFDEFVPDQRLNGLKRLNFNAMRLDPSHLRERLGYRLFREMGVVAPRATHARLIVNGEYLGVFSLVEQVDGRFTKHHFNGGDGNLYEEQWPETDDVATLTEHLETNEESADHSAMLAFYAALRDSAAEGRLGVLEQYTNVDQLMDHLAVDRTINNWDGMTGFYCSDSDCDNYNYYFYQDESEPRFTIVPWDLDQTFAVSTHFDGVPSALVIPDDCSARYEVSPNVQVLAPGCDPLFEGLARANPARFTAALGRLVDGPLELERMNTWLDEWQAQIEPGVVEDERGPGIDAFRAAVARLRADLSVLRERALAERDGQPLERFALVPGQLTDFESVSPLSIGLGVTKSSTPETRLQVALGSEGALRGARDLRASFEFRDGDTAWSQWAQIRLPLATTTTLSTSSSVRLLVRADRARDLRISLDSLAYTDRASSGEVGWDVQLDGSLQELILELSSASFPSWGLPVPESVASILASASALLFEPAATGRGEEGFLGAGVSDVGEIRIDEVQLLP
jgi:hypothetical protein